MLLETNCSTRRCKWYGGVKQKGDSEEVQFHYCPAYPKGIPKEINRGKDLHAEVREDQVGEYVYEIV